MKLKKSLTKTHKIVILLNEKDTQILITPGNQKKIYKIVKLNYINTNNNLHYKPWLDEIFTSICTDSNTLPKP